MSDTNANNEQTTTAIVSKDGVNAIAEMVFMEMKDQRDSIQRVAWERDKEACANAVFFRQLCAATSDEDDHRRFVDMRRDARKAAEKEFGTVFKGATNGATITNDLDDVRSTKKKKRAPSSNGGITGISAHHMHNAQRVSEMGFKGQDVLSELNALWKELSEEDQAVYCVLAKAYNIFGREKGDEIAPRARDEKARKAAIKQAWSELAQADKGAFLEKAAGGAGACAIPDLATRGTGGTWDDRWARRGVAGAAKNASEDRNNDALDDDALDDDATPPPPARKKAKKPRPPTASSQAA